MENQLEELNLTLSNIYFKNLNFLKSNYPKIHNKIMMLSTSIENGQYKENFSLEYKDSYFDVLNLETNEYLYGLDSYYEADLRKKRFDFTQGSSLNLLRINPETKKFSLINGLGEVKPLVNYLNSKIDFKNITFSQIFKIIYIGSGLGFHIHELNKDIKPHSTLIIEDNLELFRLSLFVIDYSEFTANNRTLFLSIDESKAERYITLDAFEKSSNWMNYTIKHQLFSIDQKPILDDIINFFSSHQASQFSYNGVLEVVKRTLGFINDEESFLNLNLLIKNKPLKNKKVLIISAGPSIDKNLEWIKENQNKFIIVCVDIVIRKLEKNSIKPDIVISIDPKTVITKFFDTQDKNFLKDSAIIFAAQQDDILKEKVKDLNKFFVQAFPISDEPGFHFSVANVGTYSFALSLFLGATELYLVGNDAAFNQETGSRYSKDDTKILIDSLEDNSELQEKGIISENDVIEVKGNLRESVKTNRELLKFKETYEYFISGHRELENEEFIAYNLSDGVYIEGLEPLEYTKVNTTSFDEKQFNINSIQDVSIKLSKISFEKEITTINKIITKVKKFQKQKVKNKEELITSKLDLMIWTLEKKKEMSHPIFSDLFLRFTELIDSYINYSLHLKQENLYNKDFLNELKRHWSNSLISLLKKIKTVISQEN